MTDSSSPPWVFAWTPPECGHVASIGISYVPAGPFSRADYRFCLVDRINRLVAAEARREAQRLLRATDTYENLNTEDRLPGAGLLLVENSDRIAELCGFSGRSVTLTAADHDEDTLDFLLGEDTLEGFIRELYPDF